MGEPDEVWAERIAQLTPYRVTSEVMAMANPGAIFLHCLPSFHDTNTTIGAEKCEQFGICLLYTSKISAPLVLTWKKDGADKRI